MSCHVSKSKRRHLPAKQAYSTPVDGVMGDIELDTVFALDRDMLQKCSLSENEGSVVAILESCGR